MRRFSDWAMDDLLPTYRIRSSSQAVYLHYEKAGLTLPGEPVPWNAEAILVEAQLRLPANARRKADFRLRLPGGQSVPAEALRRAGDGDRHRLFFRLATPAAGLTAELLWRQRRLTEVAIPILSEQEFRQNFRLALPTLFVQLDSHSVPARTAVSRQCRGLSASALLRSPVGLAPLTDLGLSVRFESEASGLVDEVPVHLSSSQLASREALVTAVPCRYPRRRDRWTARWLMGGEEVACQCLNVISPKMFIDSLRISDTRYVVAGEAGVHLRRQVPGPGEADRLGPCFLVSSREPGMAGLCELQIRAQINGALNAPVLLEQTLLVSDGPTLFAPGTLERSELEEVTGFELRLNGSLLGVLSLRPIPQANFNGEGGFKTPGEYAWSNIAEDELNERLARLMGQ